KRKPVASSIRGRGRERDRARPGQLEVTLLDCRRNRRADPNNRQSGLSAGRERRVAGRQTIWPAAPDSSSRAGPVNRDICKFERVRARRGFRREITMSVRVVRFRDRRSWEVDVRVELPDGSRYRERKGAPASTKKEAALWGEKRQAHLAKHGKHQETVEEKPRMTVAEL